MTDETALESVLELIGMAFLLVVVGLCLRECQASERRDFMEKCSRLHDLAECDLRYATGRLGQR